LKRKIAILLLTAVFVPIAFSVPLEDIVPGQAAQLRLTGDFITETQLKNSSPKLLPFDSDLRQFLTVSMGSLNPGIMVEALYLYKKPEYAYTDPTVWDNTQKTGLFNQMLAVSTLTGIQYYSASRGAMRTFFEYSNAVDGPDTKYPIPDPVYSTPPAELTLYARQTDLTFGDNVYRYNYTAAKSGIFFVQENITDLTYLTVPVIGKGNLRSVIAVFDCGDTLLFYIVSMTKAAPVPVMGNRIGSSFSNRAEAFMKWFTGRADLVFQK